MNFTDDPNTLWKYKDIINEKVSIVEIIKKYNIQLEEKGSGENYTYRIYCPFHNGKDGGVERTPSLFIYERTNSFFCFGCNNFGGPVEFVKMLEGTPISIVIQQLGKEAGILKNGEWDLELNIGNIYEFDKSKTIDPYILETSSIIRNYIKNFVNTENFDKELKWIEKVCRKLDEYLGKIGYEDWEDAVKLKNSLQKKIKSRRIR